MKNKNDILRQAKNMQTKVDLTMDNKKHLKEDQSKKVEEIMEKQKIYEEKIKEEKLNHQSTREEYDEQIKKYSEFIDYPIYMKINKTYTEEEEVDEDGLTAVKDLEEVVGLSVAVGDGEVDGLSEVGLLCAKACAKEQEREENVKLFHGLYLFKVKL